MKILKIKDPLYGQDISLVVNCSHEDLRRYLKRKYEFDLDPSPFAAGEYFVLENKTEARRRSFVWCKSFNWTAVDQSVLAHELLHLTFGILEHAGLEVTDDSDEAYTYLFEELFLRTWVRLSKLHPEHAKKIRKSKRLRKARGLRNRSKKGHAGRKAKI